MIEKRIVDAACSRNRYSEGSGSEPLDMESSSSFREARSGSSTPLRHTGPSTLSRGLSLSKVASQAASQDMRRNIEVGHTFCHCLITRQQSTLCMLYPFCCRNVSKSFKSSMLHVYQCWRYVGFLPSLKCMDTLQSCMSTVVHASYTMYTLQVSTE